ncbi:MAG TPA: hypothetical protein VF158_12490 [Longimicrobiales bacterium]
MDSSRVDPTESQLLDALRQAFASDGTADGFTTTELADQLGWHTAKVRAALHRLRKDGLVEPVRVIRENLAGGVQPVPGYRLVQRDAA